MKIGLISDTHDNIQNIQKAIISFNEKLVRVVIHAGDIVSPEAVEAFDGMKLIGVLGNNDLQVNELTDAFDNIGIIGGHTHRIQNKKVGLLILERQMVGFSNMV